MGQQAQPAALEQEQQQLFLLLSCRKRKERVVGFGYGFKPDPLKKNRPVFLYKGKFLFQAQINKVITFWTLKITNRPQIILVITHITPYYILWVFRRYFDHSDSNPRDSGAIGFVEMRAVCLQYWLYDTGVQRINKTKRCVKSAFGFIKHCDCMCIDYSYNNDVR